MPSRPSVQSASDRPRDQYGYLQPQTLQELLERADAIIAARRQKAAVR